jgi:hypothetical protein
MSSRDHHGGTRTNERQPDEVVARLKAFCRETVRFPDSPTITLAGFEAQIVIFNAICGQIKDNDVLIVNLPPIVASESHRPCWLDTNRN